VRQVWRVELLPSPAVQSIVDDARASGLARAARRTAPECSQGPLRVGPTPTSGSPPSLSAAIPRAPGQVRPAPTQVSASADAMAACRLLNNEGARQYDRHDYRHASGHSWIKSPSMCRFAFLFGGRVNRPYHHRRSDGADSTKVQLIEIYRL